MIFVVLDEKTETWVTLNKKKRLSFYFVGDEGVLKIIVVPTLLLRR
jgi:hypothetical protein